MSIAGRLTTLQRGRPDTPLAVRAVLILPARPPGAARRNKEGLSMADSNEALAAAAADLARALRQCPLAGEPNPQGGILTYQRHGEIAVWWLALRNELPKIPPGECFAIGSDNPAWPAWEATQNIRQAAEIIGAHYGLPSKQGDSIELDLSAVAPLDAAVVHTLEQAAGELTGGQPEPAATAQPQGNAKPGGKRSWKHLPDEKMPDKFIRMYKACGANNRLSLALGEQPTGNHRELERYAKAGLVWVVEQTPGGRKLEVYFATSELFAKVSDAIRKLSEKKPAAKRHGKR